jgi:CRISPR system Cascade subunit CasE
MYFSRITLRPDAEPDSVVWCDETYAVHRLVWTLFNSGASVVERDFVFRAELGRVPRILCVSAREPVDPTGIWIVETKSYDPRLRAGMRLAFSLRANPVVSRPGKDGRSRRHDVVMDAKRQSRETGGDPFSYPEAVQSACSAWLMRRRDRMGAEIDEKSLRCDGYRVLRIRRGKGQGVMTLGTAEIQGHLTVRDPDALREVLFSGLGHGKGFGCGLLMVRRA